MSSYKVFYHCYSREVSAEEGDGVTLTAEQIVVQFAEIMLKPDDFFGIVDANNVTLQFMRNRVDRVWMEIPCPEKDGSYGGHIRLNAAIDVLKSLPASFEQLKHSLVFQSWDGENDEKLYAVPEEQVRKLTEDHGAAFATDLVTCQDMGVGYMYREAPDFEEDSGWRFLSGEEDQDYMNVSANSGIFDVNTVANYDPDIIPFLNAPVGSAFARNDDDVLVPAEDVEDEEEEEQEDNEFDDDDDDDDGEEAYNPFVDEEE